MANIDELERRIASLESTVASLSRSRTVQSAHVTRGSATNIRQVYVIAVDAGTGILTVRAIRRATPMDAWEWFGGAFEAEPMAMMPIGAFTYFIVSDIASAANTSFWAIKESGVWRVAFLPKFAYADAPAIFVDECI